MNKRELSRSKKVIFVGGVCMSFIAAAFFTFLIPGNYGDNAFLKIIVIIPILLGLFIAVFIKDKPMKIKVIMILIGIGIVLIISKFLSLTDVGKVVGLYVGGFIGGILIIK